jgi:hypothetical protein
VLPKMIWGCPRLLRDFWQFFISNFVEIMDTFPNDILRRIGIELPPSSLLSFSLVCSATYQPIQESDENDTLFWKNYAIKNYKIVMEPENLVRYKQRVGSQTWKLFAKYLSKLDYSHTFWVK